MRRLHVVDAVDETVEAPQKACKALVRDAIRLRLVGHSCRQRHYRLSWPGEDPPGRSGRPLRGAKMTRNPTGNVEPAVISITKKMSASEIGSLRGSRCRRTPQADGMFAALHRFLDEPSNLAFFHRAAGAKADREPHDSFYTAFGVTKLCGQEEDCVGKNDPAATGTPGVIRDQLPRAEFHTRQY